MPSQNFGNSFIKTIAIGNLLMALRIQGLQGSLHLGRNLYIKNNSLKNKNSGGAAKNKQVGNSVLGNTASGNFNFSGSISAE